MPRKPTKSAPGDSLAVSAAAPPGPRPALPLHYCKILPKKKSMLVSHYTYLTNSQIMEIIFQYETFVQLLLQNYLFISNKDKRLEIYNLIQKINLEKMQVLFMNGLRPCDVFLVDFKYGNFSLMTVRNYMSSRLDMQSLPINVEKVDQAVSFQMAPQVSVLQAAALEALSLVSQAVAKGLPRDKKALLLRELVPLLQRQYVPVFPEESKQASGFKFSPADDALLLAGLQKFGSKALYLVQENFLPHKSLDEIRNRFKNLTRFKSPRNPIKNWKLLEIAPLTEAERQNFEKGKLWFGATNYKLIARFFLPSRSDAFLRAQDTMDKKLLAKRSQCYFEFPDESLESVVLDLASDFVPDSPQQTAANEEFVRFLKALPFNVGLLGHLALDAGAQDYSYFTFKLSENKMMLASRDRTERDTFLINQNSIINSKIRILDNKVFVINNKINERKLGVQHQFVGEGGAAAKRVKTATAEGSVRRLCPTSREILDIVDRLKEKSEFKYNDLAVHQVLKFE